jgi:hypothetical protein
VVTKFPLVAAFFALVFALGSLFGLGALGAGIAAFGGAVAPRLTDFLFWLGMMSTSLVVLTLYSVLLQKLGIVETPKPSQGKKQLQESLTSASGTAADS